MTDQYLNVCPYCSGTLRIDVFQGDCKPTCISSDPLFGSRLRYSVCRNCGSVVRSYMEPDETRESKNNRN